MIRQFDIMLAEHAIKHSSDQALFSLETFYIVNYFNRHISKYKLDFESVTTLNIVIGETHTGLEYNTEWSDTRKILGCVLTNSYENLNTLIGDKRAEQVLEFFALAANLYEEKIAGISQSVSEISNKFRKENYINCWNLQKKNIKDVGAVYLKCMLNITSFQLFLVFSKQKNIFYKIKILETRPDSIFYSNLFKNVLIKENNIYLYAQIPKQHFFSISFDELLTKSAGKFIQIHPSNPDFIFDRDKKFFTYKLEESNKIKKGTKWWNNFKLKHKENIENP